MSFVFSPHRIKKKTAFVFLFFALFLSSLFAEIQTGSFEPLRASTTTWMHQDDHQEGRNSVGNITAEDYCAFLNEVAANDLFHFYDFKMGWDGSIPLILRLGTPGSYYYVVLHEKEKDPISYLTAFAATRFCHWLENRNPLINNEEACSAPICAYGNKVDPALVSNDLFFQIIQHSDLNEAYAAASTDSWDTWDNIGFGIAALLICAGGYYACSSDHRPSDHASESIPLRRGTAEQTRYESSEQQDNRHHLNAEATELENLENKKKVTFEVNSSPWISFNNSKQGGYSVIDSIKKTKKGYVLLFKTCTQDPWVNQQLAIVNSSLSRPIAGHRADLDRWSNYRSWYFMTQLDKDSSGSLATVSWEEWSKTTLEELLGGDRERENLIDQVKAVAKNNDLLDRKLRYLRIKNFSLEKEEENSIDEIKNGKNKADGIFNYDVDHTDFINQCEENTALLKKLNELWNKLHPDSCQAGTEQLKKLQEQNNQLFSKFDQNEIHHLLIIKKHIFDIQRWISAYKDKRLLHTADEELHSINEKFILSLDQSYPALTEANFSQFTRIMKSPQKTDHSNLLALDIAVLATWDQILTEKTKFEDTYNELKAVTSETTTFIIEQLESLKSEGKESRSPYSEIAATLNQKP